MLNVKMGISLSSDPAVAAHELFNAIDQPDISFALFYCSSEYDLSSLAEQLNDRFAGIDLIGCTSAGEISSAGYTTGSLIGLSIASPEFIVATTHIERLSDYQLSHGEATVSTVTEQLRAQGKIPSGDQTFGFLLIDGLSLKEEVVVSSLHQNLLDIQLIGGSAADGLAFENTYVYYEGAFHTDSALFSLIHTTHPFKVFKTEHFAKGDEDIVVTEADASKRIVSELNGLPAAEEYARITGVEDVDQLAPAVLATNPVVVSIGGEDFVRSVLKMNEDQTISFACAIDDGLVLSVAEAQDMVADLEATLACVHQSIPKPSVILGCDFVFRMIEMEQKGLRQDIGRMLAENKVFGFSTYGEQYNGMHVNQTLTGIAIGA